MSEAQFESDEFLKLLTEALRAGPASPQWHEAVARLRQVNPAEADEYRLLIQAREDLESGRDYRSISPGPGFTRKVMDRIDREGDAGPRVSPASLIAILGGLAILGVLALVIFLVVRGGGGNGTIADLAATDFARAAGGADFSQEIPAAWKTFGLVPVVSTQRKALRGGVHPDTNEYQGGGVYQADAIPVGQSFAVDATLQIRKSTANVDLQLFITESPAFTGPKATSPRELIVDVRDGQISVYKPDMSPAGEPLKLVDGKDAVMLSIKMDRQFVIVTADGKEVYAGPHGLAADKPRWPGVRFLTRGPERALDDVTVQSIRILKP